MKVFYLLTVCFRSLVEPASLLGFSDQLEDPSYLFSKQNSQFQSKFQYFSRQPDFSFVVFPLQDIHIRKIIWLVKRSVTSHGNSPKWNPSLSPKRHGFIHQWNFFFCLKYVRGSTFCILWYFSSFGLFFVFVLFLYTSICTYFW